MRGGRSCCPTRRRGPPSSPAPLSRGSQRSSPRARIMRWSTKSYITCRFTPYHTYTVPNTHHTKNTHGSHTTQQHTEYPAPSTPHSAHITQPHPHTPHTSHYNATHTHTSHLTLPRRRTTDTHHITTPPRHLVTKPTATPPHHHTTAPQHHHTPHTTHLSTETSYPCMYDLPLHTSTAVRMLSSVVPTRFSRPFPSFCFKICCSAAPSRVLLLSLSTPTQRSGMQASLPNTGSERSHQEGVPSGCE